MTLPTRFPLMLAIGVVALVIWMGVQTLFQDRRSEQLQEPSARERPERLLFNVSLRPIAAFSHYYGKKEDTWAPYNPFIPPENRINEIALVNNPEPEPVQIPRPIYQKEPKGPPPPEPQIAPLDLAAKQLPEVVGGLSQGSEPYVLALHNNSLDVMGIGQTIGNWLLVRIEGNSAWFIPVDGGSELRVPIGMADGSTAVETARPSSRGVNTTGPRTPAQTNRPISLRDPRVRRLLEENPDLVDRIRRNPEQVEDLIREALEQKGG